MPQISLPRPRIASPTARNSSAFSFALRVGDSPVEPATTTASVPLSTSQDASCCAPSRSTAWSSSRNGVTMAVTTDPNLPACPVIGALSSRRAPPGGRRRCAYASGPCRASTRRPATTAPPACSTAGVCRRTTSSPRPTARPTRRWRCSGSRGRSRRRRRWPRTMLALQRELFVVGADLAANPDERAKLVDGVSLVTATMTERLEGRIDALVAERALPAVFIVPGANAVERRARRGPEHDPARGARGGRAGARPAAREPRGAPLPQPPERPAVRARPLGSRRERAREPSSQGG